MANQTLIHAFSTDQYTPSIDGDSSFLDLDSLQDLFSLVHSLTKDQIKELLNATGYDETVLHYLSSKFVLVKSCDEDLNETPETGNLSDVESNAVVSQSFLYGIENRGAAKSHKTEAVPRELQVQKTILLYIPLVIYTIGVVGNCLSFSVLVRRRMRRVSTYTYLAVLSVVDTFVLTVGLLVIWTGEVTGASIRDRSDFSCKIISALGYTVSDLSVWLIIAVTVERFIAVCYPLKAATTCRRKTAVKVILSLLAVMVLLNLHFFWTTKIKVYDTAQSVKLILSESGAIVRCPAQDQAQKRCMSADGYDFLVNRFWPWLDAIVYSFLPFVIIIILNSLIITKVWSARRKRCMMTIQSTASMNRNETGRHDRSSKRAISSSSVPKNLNSYSSLRQENWKLEKQTFSSNNQQPRRDATNETNVMLSLMLLTISFAFLLMTLPMNIMLIITNLLNSTASTAANSQHHHWARLAVTITELLMYLNHSTNFFLYCATGQKFRFELKRMVTGWASPPACCKKRCCAKKWSSLAEDDRNRNNHLDWSLRNNNANQTMHEKSQANQTIIMNTITSKNT